MSNYSKPDHHHVGVASRKRKERDTPSVFGMKANKQTEPTTLQPPTLSKSPAADNNNWLLAGYLAHEFLTQGTLLGQKWDPSRAEANPITPRNNSPRIRGGGGRPTVGGGAAGAEAKAVRPQQQQAVHSSYADVSSMLLKSEGAHIEGIVNPTQLARWLHL
ncbi:hypothetical protein MKX01_039647 [Papaver californicum]|nr:hypothetical protein MKX01_039647 [Papaver californicum]